jgi:branched-subunit amino acid aminotransferase/4-amino-4-deoxychorismate lyase
MTATELAAADEILMSSTSACLVPVTRLNGRPVGTGRPGQLWQDLINDWSAAVGVDIVAQTSVAP